MFPTNKRRFRFLLLLVSAALLATGCSLWKDKDTKTPVQPQTGVIDMNKAIKAHPKYSEVIKLEQQYNAMRASAEAKAGAALAQQPTPDISVPDMSKLTAGINAALEQEFKTQMAGKQAELNEQLKAKSVKLHSTLTDELKAYNDELDKIYQPQIFSLQLKLKTVQLTKEQMASMQSEIEKLQNERAEKLAAKKQELTRQMDQQLAPEQAAMEKQLSAYAAQLHAKLEQKGAQQAAEAASRNQPQISAPAVPLQPQAGRGELEEQLAAKRSEIEALKQLIITDVRDKAAKVAAERGLDTVLAKVQVNVSAIDITGDVINQFSASNIRLQ